MRRGPVTGGQVVRSVVAIVLATAVVPPAAAWWLNGRRIAMTMERAASAAATGALRPGGGVVCGPGRLPTLTADRASAFHLEWLGSARMDPAAFGPGMPTDAWGRCFLMSDRWILSAGPNGVIDTPRDAAALAGDDIGAVLK